jgi:hypothetical protein
MDTLTTARSAERPLLRLHRPRDRRGFRSRAGDVANRGIDEGISNLFLTRRRTPPARSAIQKSSHFPRISTPFLIQSQRQKGEQNHGGHNLNSPHHNPAPAPQPRAHRRNTKPLPPAHLTSPWLHGYMATRRSSPHAGAKPSHPANAPDAPSPNPDNARQTLPNHAKPRHTSKCAKRSHPPKQQSLPPLSLPLLPPPQPRAGAIPSHRSRPIDNTQTPDARSCTRKHGYRKSRISTRPA